MSTHYDVENGKYNQWKAEGRLGGERQGSSCELEREHWDFYKALMMSLFEEDDVENIATGKAKPPDPSASESDKNEWKQNQATIKRLILSSVSLALAQRVMRQASGTEMWKKLEEIFEAPKNQNLFVHQQRQLAHQLRNTRAKREDDMNLHLGKMYDIRDRLATMKYAVHDLDMVDAILKSLPRHVKYQRLTEMITLTPGSAYSVDDVRDLILVAASQLKEESYENSGDRMENGGNRAGGGDAKAGKAGKQKNKPKHQQQHQQQSESSENHLKCFQLRVHEDVLYRDRHSIPKSVDHGWPDDQQGDVEGGGDSEDDESDNDQESSVEADLDTVSSNENEKDSSTSSKDSEEESDANEDEEDVADSDEDARREPSLMHPRVFLRPMADENADEHANEHVVDDGGEEEIESSKSGEDVQDADSVEDAVSGEKDDSVNESEHGDVSAVSEDATSKAIDETESVTSQDEQTHEENDNEDVLRDYEDVVNEGDLPGVEQERADEYPQDIDVETYGLEDDDVETTMIEKRKRVDRIRSFSEQPKYREKRGRDSIAGRREDKRQRYEPRERKRPKYLEDYVMNSTLHPEPMGQRSWKASEVKIPKTVRQAMRSRQCNEWVAAMETQMQALIDKGVLTPIDELPDGANLLETKWVFDPKVDEDGYIVRFRARIVAKGFKQKPGLDFKDTFSPVARLSSFRLLVALARELGWKIWQGDVNNAYLNAKLKIKQYIGGIEGFGNQMYRVDQALYGLRQSGREWNEELDGWMKKYGFTPCETEPCLYFYAKGDVMAFVLIYVDDVIITTNSVAFKSEFFAALDKDYGFKDLGLLTNYLGIRVRQKKTETVLDQEQVDNQSSYVMATNPTFGRRTRHIELKWHYVREQVRKKELYMLKVRSEDNPADLFTKPLAKARFEGLSTKIGMCTRNVQS
ncbi:Integrase catalytic core protein [Phytophthora cinnamomi]|uniref:Integrase catalytic core protein n=1 Tax=Phytophthora cinnamomi TaxID=4785 RepID=UPI003559C2E3|nr:Integrase catalytic core protein [Phytophthora cinnamomi]